MDKKPVEQIKQGDYVKRKDTALATYVRGAYDKASKRYELTDTSDCNRSVYVKKGTELCVGFTY